MGYLSANHPRHLIAALLQILLNVKGHGWAVRGVRRC